MHSAHYHCWTPDRSPVRIEFPAALLRELNREFACGDQRGFLFGVRYGADLRLVAAARIDPSAESLDKIDSSTRIGGLEKIGVFVRRERGEIIPDGVRFQNGLNGRR